MPDGKNTCPPAHDTMHCTTASATSAGSIMASPWACSADSTGAASGVRTQLGWTDVVRILGAW